jgi:hypothetical protein
MNRTLRLRSLTLLLVIVALTSWGCGDEPDPGSEYDRLNAERVRHYIRGDEYSRLVLEVDYVAGLTPTPEAISGLVSGLEGLLDKPGGVEVVVDQELTPRGDDYGWTDDAVSQLEEETFDLEVSDDTIKMHVLFLDGHDARDDDDTHILGISWGNRNVAIYKQQLGEACDAEPEETLKRRGLLERVCQQTELAIWTHEVGHVLGLVAYGLPMVEDHEDPDHPNHDHNDECIMYWAYDRRQALDQVKKRFLEDEDADPLGFDEACRADIAAVRDD